MPSMRHIPIIAAGLALISLFAATADAQSNRATFPQNFDQYVLYATYDRGSSKEEAFATPETLAIAKSGQPLPPGTRLVLGIWSNNTLTDYFVMEKGVGWGADFTPEQRTGDWHFQQFAPGRCGARRSPDVASPVMARRRATISCSRPTECGPTFRDSAVPVSPDLRFTGGQLVSRGPGLRLARQCRA